MSIHDVATVVIQLWRVATSGDGANVKQYVDNAGKMRFAGRDYVVRDGDVIHFRFNV